MTSRRHSDPRPGSVIPMQDVPLDGKQLLPRGQLYAFVLQTGTYQSMHYTHLTVTSKWCLASKISFMESEEEGT